jgi:hypothetical protein
MILVLRICFGLLVWVGFCGVRLQKFGGDERSGLPLKDADA